MKALTFLRHLVAAAAVLAAGCSTMISYDPSLTASYIKQTGRPVPGAVFVYTTPQQDAYVYAGRPTTYTGSAVAAHIPFGKMTRDIATVTFEGAFLQGATAGSSLGGVTGKPLIVMPSVKAFDYFYALAPGSMFKSVANVHMKLHAKVLTSDAEVLIDKTYNSPRVLSESTAGYLPKLLSKVSHTVLCDLMSELARDVKLLVLQQQSPVTPAPPTPVRAAPSPTPAPVYTPQPAANPPTPSYLTPEVIPAPEMVPNQ